LKSAFRQTGLKFITAANLQKMSEQAVDNYQFLGIKVYRAPARLFTERTEMFVNVHRAFLPDENSAKQTGMFSNVQNCLRQLKM
jgi:hypothetical protein